MSQVIRKRRKSHLTRGAWIEIDAKEIIQDNARRRTSHEVRGLK